ncbi:AraC family transcriptional regulator [bacterium]|nr:MAG: AraC family transcriptional regulator [bacterium]
MDNLAVQLIRLEPMRVATAYGFGENPEELAWQALVAWASPKCLLDDLEAHPIFGLNNPYPGPDSPKYGYEFWLKVGPEVEPEGYIRVEEFFGGLYAVTRCEVKGHPEVIPETWQKLAQWCGENRHPLGHHPALERFLSSPGDLEDLVLNLCCPIWE